MVQKINNVILFVELSLRDGGRLVQETEPGVLAILRTFLKDLFRGFVDVFHLGAGLDAYLLDV